jgi:hypothetical protein
MLKFVFSSKISFCWLPKKLRATRPNLKANPPHPNLKANPPHPNLKVYKRGQVAGFMDNSGIDYGFSF